MNSLWYSPVQDQSSGNASLLQWGEGFLILNYIIDGCAAIISFSLLSGLADFSSNWEGRLIAFSLKSRSSPSLLYISSTSKMLSYLTARFTSLKSSGDSSCLIAVPTTLKSFTRLLAGRGVARARAGSNLRRLVESRSIAS